MLVIKFFAVLFFLILADSAKSGTRQNLSSLKKEPQTRVAKRLNRGEVFDNLFNVYDPSFLAVVWPKITNGLHILVDPTCWTELGVFFRDLTDGRPWAYSVLDASGRYESALFSGNRFWLGSKKQCLLLDDEAVAHNGTHNKDNNGQDDDDGQDWRWVEREQHFEQYEVSNKMSVIHSDRFPPYRIAYSTLQIYLNITKTNMNKLYDLTLGVCLPLSCSPRDVTSVINFSIMINDNLKTNKTVSRTAKIAGARQIPGYYDFGGDVAAILLMCITVLLTVLVIAATVVDLDWIKCLPYGKQSKTFDLEKYNVDTISTKRSTEKENIEQDSIKDETEKVGLENANVNYMAVENFMKNAPAITLDVTCADKSFSSCSRCGKYRKQCSSPLEQTKIPCPRLQYNSFTSLNVARKKQSIFYRLLLCFSLSYCCKRVFNTNVANKDLALIHGMRIFATFWVIFLHIAIIVDYISESAENVNEQNNIYYIISTGTIAFDTLFLVSGIFSSHHFFYLKSQHSLQELVGWSGPCGHSLQFLCFVFNRIIRLLPSYTYALMLSSVVARWSRSTATLALPDGDHRHCNSYWWRNFLYLSNIYPINEQCMQISWYMSTETQVHMFGAILCAVSAASSLRARISIALALVAVLCATVTDASAAFFDFGQLFSSGFDVYGTIIERPLARVAPYFIGVFVGWLVHVIQGKLKVSKVTTSLLWVSSISFIVMSVAVTFVGLPWLAAWIHLSWPIALLWPVLMGTTNLAAAIRRVLTRPPVAALSRLCYGMLLLHPAVARAVLLSLDTSLCSETVCVWLYFAGTTTLTLLSAFILCILVEIPFCTLFRRLSDCTT